MSDSPTPPGLTARDRGLGVYALLLIGGVVGSLLLAGWALSVIIDDSARLQELYDQGVIGPGDRLEIVHDHSSAQDNSAGCAIVEGQLVRWEEASVTDRVPMYAGEVTVKRGSAPAVVLTSPDGEQVACPFAPGEDMTAFTEQVRMRAITRLPEQRTWQPNDPRLREHFGIEGAPQAD